MLSPCIPYFPPFSVHSSSITWQHPRPPPPPPSHTHMHTHAHTHTHTPIRTHTHTETHAHMHTNRTHALLRPRALSSRPPLSQLYRRSSRARVTFSAACRRSLSWRDRWRGERAARQKEDLPATAMIGSTSSIWNLVAFSGDLERELWQGIHLRSAGSTGASLSRAGRR